MADFNIRSDAVNVEQVMEQIRARIREKRGVDYTEEQISALAAVKLEKFLDPRGMRSDLLEQYRRMPPPPERPNYAFGEDTLFETHRGPIRWIRTLLRPLLKLFFNPNPLIQALHIQAQLNETNARRESDRYALDQINFELIHNLVVELTRLGIEVKNVKMRAESLASRLEFNERRARALESVVVYRPAEERESAAPVSERHAAQFPQPMIQRPAVVAPIASSYREPQARPEQGQGQAAAAPGAGAPGPPGPGQRSRRRRRRRGRRGGGAAAVMMGGGPAPESQGEQVSGDAADSRAQAESGDSAVDSHAGGQSEDVRTDSRPPDDDPQ